MLGSWFNYMPLFIVRWAAFRYGETLNQGGALLKCGPKDVYFYAGSASSKADTSE